MKNSKLLPPFIAIIITVCLLVGCTNAKEAPLPDTGEADTPVAESTAKENKEPFSFADISNLEFWFGSGAGAWCTVLTVHANGTFEGEYHDSDIGSSGDAYPYGTYYLCNFTGNFAEPEKLNDYTYSVRIEQMDLERSPGTEEIKEGIKYIYSGPYGLEDAEEVLFYMPGAPIQELPEGYRDWVGYSQITDTQLPFYGLYNVKAENGFSSYEKIEMPIDDEPANTKQTDQ